jgi:hypothetical protein
MDIVTLVNRCSTTVEGVFDGVPIVLKPHERRPLLANQAEMIKRQNPVMGTEDPNDLASPEWLVGIEEWGDDCTPIERSDKEERFDRSLVNDADGQKAKPMRLQVKPGSRVKVATNDDNPVGIQNV